MTHLIFVHNERSDPSDTHCQIYTGITRRIPAPCPTGSRWSCKFAPGEFVCGASLRLILRAPFGRANFLQANLYAARPCALPYGLPVGRANLLPANLSNPRAFINPLSPPHIKKAPIRGLFYVWRRERDSNPRYGLAYTHFPGVLLQPLGHLSSLFQFLMFDNTMSYSTAEHLCVLVTPGVLPFAPLGPAFGCSNLFLTN